MRIAHRSNLAAQRGSTLLLGLLVCALMMVLVADLTSVAQLEYEQSLNASDLLLIDAGLNAGLEIAKANLIQDAADTEIDSLSESWNQPIEEELTPPESNVSARKYRRLNDTSNSGGTTVHLKIEIEDEERKWPLGLLVIGNDAQIKRRREGLVGVIDAFRDGTSLDVGLGDAERIADLIMAFINRKEGEFSGPVPRPLTKSPLHILNIGDLGLIPGLDDSMMYDAVLEDGSIVPGLSRFLTISTDNYINVNTAALPVLRGLFRSDDRTVADDIFHSRTQKEADNKRERDSTAGQLKTQEEKDKDKSGGAVFEKVDDLGKLPTVVPRLLSEIRTAVDVKSTVFSVWVTAEAKSISRTRHWILRRQSGRFVMLLSEAIDNDYRPRWHVKTDEEVEQERRDQAAGIDPRTRREEAANKRAQARR